MLQELKQKVWKANLELPRRNLVTYTWGNVSGIDRDKGLMVIKPAGVEYDEITPDMLVVLDPVSYTHLDVYKRQLLFRNALTGIGTPDWEPQERASFLGVSAHHTLSDFSRAVFEGIADVYKRQLLYYTEFTSFCKVFGRL